MAALPAASSNSVLIPMTVPTAVPSVMATQLAAVIETPPAVPSPTPTPVTAAGLEAQAQPTIAQAESLMGMSLDEVILVGHGMGGAASIAFAAAHPDRVAGLLLAATPGKTAPAQGKAIAAALRADYEKVMHDDTNKLLDGARPEVRAQVLADMRNIQPYAAERMIAEVFAFDPVRAMSVQPLYGAAVHP